MKAIRIHAHGGLDQLRIDRAQFRAMTGADPVQGVGEAKLEPLVKAGFLEIRATHLVATPAGRQRLNAVLERLLA